MRRIFLVRHGQPDFPGGERHCIGSSDFPLSALGRLQACLLDHALREEKLSVFSSPLSRARDTAAFLSPEYTVMDELREMHAGDWEGLSFRDIKKRWPELFEARAGDTGLPIPGSEDWEAGQRRFISGVEKALSESRGDIAIVAHTTVILSFICRVMASEEYRNFKYRQDCGSYYLILQDESGLHCRFPWQRPVPELESGLCLKLMDAAGLPENVKAHCIAVAREADRIAAELESAGLSLNRADIRRAALLHDIARLEPDHPETGAGWLEALGYGSIARIIRQHHDIDSPEIDEAAVVYIADKLTAEAEQVSLKARFEKSLKKCGSPEAVAAHRRRAAQAMGIAQRINQLCDKEVIT